MSRSRRSGSSGRAKKSMIPSIKMLGRDPHTPEPVVVAPVLGEEVGPERGAQELGRERRTTRRAPPAFVEVGRNHADRSNVSPTSQNKACTSPNTIPRHCHACHTAPRDLGPSGRPHTALHSYRTRHSAPVVQDHPRTNNASWSPLGRHIPTRLRLANGSRQRASCRPSARSTAGSTVDTPPAWITYCKTRRRRTR